jgi:hypothetical protein
MSVVKMPGFTAESALLVSPFRSSYITSSIGYQTSHEGSIHPAFARTSCPNQFLQTICPGLIQVADVFPCGIFMWWGDINAWRTCLKVHVPFCEACSFDYF